MNVVIKVGKKDLAYHDPKAFEARLREELSSQQGLSISSLAISFVNEPDSTATVNERAYSEQVNPIVKAVGTTCFNLCAEAGEFNNEDQDLIERMQIKINQLLLSYDFLPGPGNNAWHKIDKSKRIRATIDDDASKLKLEIYAAKELDLHFEATVHLLEYDDAALDAIVKSISEFPASSKPTLHDLHCHLA